MNVCCCDVHERRAALLLEQLRLRGMRLLERDQLLWVYPRSAITLLDRELIAEHRDALLALVAGERRN